jgi:O-antigen/teichoic acid export membrane protein
MPLENPSSDSTKPRNLRQKFIKNFFAFGYSQAVTLAVQFLTVPFFLRYWGQDRYAEWLVLSGIPIMLGLLDFGVAHASASKSTIHAAKQDIHGVRRSFQTALAFSLSVFLFLLFCGFFLSTSLDWTTFLKLSTLDHEEASFVLMLLLGHLGINLLSGPLNAWFMAMDQASIGYFLLANRRLLDVFATISVLVLGGTAITLACTLIIVQALAWLILLSVAWTLSPWNILGLREASWNEFRSIAKPAAAHAGITIGQVITLQGGLQILNQLSSPGVVVLYSMGRTLMRMVLQIGVVGNHALRPELSRLLSIGKYDQANVFTRRVSYLATALAFCTYLGLILFGPWIVYWWSNGQVTISHEMLALIGMHAFINPIWFVPSTYLMASNQHVRLATVFLVASLFSMFFWLFNLSSAPPLLAAALALFIPELAAAIYLMGASTIFRRTKAA